MPFESFHDLFPTVAEAETRSVVLPVAQGALPAGAYHFQEMFCNERGCDCRRVFFLVDTSFREGPEAVVAWGWEDIAFYRAWIKHGNKKDAQSLIGPILNPGSPRTELAPGILALFQEVLLKDRDYLERVKRHYRMFREAIETGKIPSLDEHRRERSRGRQSETQGDHGEETEPRLTPCPFCGGTDLLQPDKMADEDAEAPEEWFVVCGTCGAIGPRAPSCANARAGWNCRTHPKGTTGECLPF